jgi:hypothetical protein
MTLEQFSQRVNLTIGYCICSILFIVSPHANADRADDVLLDALVRVTCAIPGKGKLVSTGFVWPNNGYIVTALHGVAGCKPGKLSVKSEKTADLRYGRVHNVSQEGDLALVQLVNRQDAPMPFPNNMVPLTLSRDKPIGKKINYYSISSYPEGGSNVNSHLAFLHRKPLVGDLGTAFTHDTTIDELLSSQTYPRHNTQVLRIKDLLRHGQSGAPIVDPSGRLIAIADGGLNGGFLGMNWAVVADEYLDRLLKIKETPPRSMSTTAEAHLISALLPEDRKIVKVPPGVQGLEHVRRLPLPYLYETLLRRKQTGKNYSGLNGLTNIMKFSEPAEFQNLSFDVYEDPATGATIGVPSQLDLQWNPAMQALIANDETSVMVVFVRRYGTYANALKYGKQEIVGSFSGENWVDFETREPLEHMMLNRQDEDEWANRSRFYDSTFDQVKQSLNLSITISGDTLLGYALISTDKVESLSDAQFVRYFMMETSVIGLADFAVH